jgi:hypothetical protein
LGRNYVAERLTKRIAELDTIQQESQGVAPGTMATSGLKSELQSTASVPLINEGTAIELNLLLDSIANACQGGDAGGEALSRFTVTDATRALLIIFRLAPTAPPDFEADLMGKIDNIVNLLDGILDPDMDVPGERVEARENALSLHILFRKLREYLTKMIAGRNMSVPERIALSKALVADLGFSKSLKSTSTRANLESQFRTGEMNPKERQTFREGDMDDENDDDDFDDSGTPREDSQHFNETGVARGDREFDVDGRAAFGEQRTARGTLGVFPAYYNEEALTEQPPLNDEEDTGETMPFPLGDEEREIMRRQGVILPPNPRVGSVAARMAEEATVRGRFDEDTQGFNIQPRRAPSSVRAPSRRSSVSTRAEPERSRAEPERSRVWKEHAPRHNVSAEVLGRMGLPNNKSALPRANERGAAERIEAIISALEAEGIVNIRAQGIKNRKDALIRQMSYKGYWS